MKQLALSVCLAMLVGAVVGCTLRSIKMEEIGDMVADKNKVLIATESSEFKTAVVSDIVTALRSEGAYIRIIDVSQLNNEDPGNYNAILIVNTCMAWSLGAGVMTFLDTVPQKDKVFVLATAGDPDWRAGLTSVDAMTSASVLDKADTVAQAIIEKIRAKL